MATAGPSAPSGGRNVLNGGVPWSTPGNITADDASYATVTLSGNNSDILTADYVFSVPAGSTIDGIELTVKGKVSSGTLSTYLYPDLAGTSATVTLTTTEATYTTGGPTSTFGHTWTVPQVNALVVDCFNQTIYTGTISINYVTAKVYYTVPVVNAPPRRAFVPQQTGPRALIPQQPGDLTAQNFSYRAPLPGAHTVFHPTPQMLGPRAFRPQSQYDPRVEVAPVAYQPPLPGAETPYHPTPHMLGPRGFRPQRYDPYTPDATTIFNTIVLSAGDAGPVSIPLWTKGLYKPMHYPPLRYSPLRFKPPRYRKPF